MNNTEQWKTRGNCKECRRYNYCTKPCRANKIRVQLGLGLAVSKAMALVIGGKK